ncbi:MAG: inositol monophosphatase [Marinilabiliaceae bacterium]|nr:inositol monophosphatase [Marinilabiliaceae bacterium]
MNYEILCQKVITIVRKTGEFIKSERQKNRLDIESKGKNDLVTHVDKASEEQLIKQLGELVPNSGFIAEEHTDLKQGDQFSWIIDPIDGTTNFIHGLSPFAISVALQENNETVIGVVYELGLEECFYSWKGGEAFCNGNVISTSSVNSLSESLIATGFPYSNYSRMDEFIQSLQFFMNNTQGVRRMGSAATDLAYVACGRFESFYEYNLKPWDVAAGAFLVTQAGGKVSDFSGNNNFLFGREIVAANEHTYKEFQSHVKRLMNN